MALPQKIQVNAITGASLPSTLDNDINAGLKQPLIDIFGIPDNTNITAAVMTVNASGLDSVNFRDSAANPGAAGKLQRNAADLLFHDGTSAKVVALATATQTLTGKTINLSNNTLTGTTAQFNTALSDGDFATLAGSETLTNKTLTAPAISSPVLSGSATGTYTLAGTPTITAPTISSPVLSGTATGTYTIGGTPTIAAPTITGLTTLTGGQIAFPATQSASADANTLDDYEEGTWTPTVGGTATYTSQGGQYIKIGRLVQLWGLISINVIGTGSTSLISGLPFPIVSGGAHTPGSAWWSTLATNVVNVSPVGDSGFSQVQFWSTAAAGTSQSILGIFGNGTTMYFNLVYRTNN